ncbi:hypothetical protein RCL1_005936 [Eukaryota sp. TZLM3-RCL]
MGRGRSGGRSSGRSSGGSRRSGGGGRRSSGIRSSGSSFRSSGSGSSGSSDDDEPLSPAQSFIGFSVITGILGFIFVLISLLEFFAEGGFGDLLFLFIFGCFWVSLTVLFCWCAIRWRGKQHPLPPCEEPNHNLSLVEQPLDSPLDSQSPLDQPLVSLQTIPPAPYVPLAGIPSILQSST